MFNPFPTRKRDHGRNVCTTEWERVMKRLRILLADDHAVVIEGLRRILDRPEFEVVGVASDGWALFRLQPDCTPM